MHVELFNLIGLLLVNINCNCIHFWVVCNCFKIYILNTFLPFKVKFSEEKRLFIKTSIQTLYVNIFVSYQCIQFTNFIKCLKLLGKLLIFQINSLYKLLIMLQSLVFDYNHFKFLSWKVYDRITNISWYYVFLKKYKLTVSWGGTLKSKCSWYCHSTISHVPNVDHGDRTLVARWEASALSTWTSAIE